MLVLSRKQDEKILIGDDIVITILRVKGNTIRVGIEAPKGVRIVRAELDTTANTSEPKVTPESIDSKKDRPQPSRNRLRVASVSSEAPASGVRSPKSEQPTVTNRLTKEEPAAHTDRTGTGSGPLGSYVLAARIPLPSLATDLNSRVG